MSQEIVCFFVGPLRCGVKAFCLDDRCHAGKHTRRGQIEARRALVECHFFRQCKCLKLLRNSWLFFDNGVLVKCKAFLGVKWVQGVHYSLGCLVLQRVLLGLGAGTLSCLTSYLTFSESITVRQVYDMYRDNSKTTWLPDIFQFCITYYLFIFIFINSYLNWKNCQAVKIKFNTFLNDPRHLTRCPYSG